MFDLDKFDDYPFEKIPLNRDAFMMDEVWMGDYERSVLGLHEGKDYDPVGWVDYIAAKSVVGNVVELSWFPNISTRFHELTIVLPRDAFVRCVESIRFDDKVRVFVRSEWLRTLHSQTFSAFALVDVIGVRRALQDRVITQDAAMRMRGALDTLAASHPDVAFISVADSVIVKSNWSVGRFDSDIKYSYDPETFLRSVNDVRSLFKREFGLGSYAIVTQGANEFYGASLLHVSASGNHVSLDSLGVPFAELFSIDEAAHDAIRRYSHAPSELYLDDKFFYSLNWRLEFDRDRVSKNKYKAKMMSKAGEYHCIDFATVFENIRVGSDERA